MKKIICLALMLIMVLSLASCVIDQKYDYDMTKYVSLPNIAGKEIEVKLDYIQSTIDSDIISSSAVTSNKYTAQSGDNVTMVITIKEMFWLGDGTIDSSKDANGNENVLFTTDNAATTDVVETIVIKNLGAGSFHTEIENKFLKKKLGQEHTDTYKLPADLTPLQNMLTAEQYAKIAPYAGKDCYITYKFVSRPVREGDIVSVTYTGYYTDDAGNIKIGDDGKEATFSGGSGTSNVYIGSRTFIEDFEKGLIGFEVGKEGQFKATFPSDYGVDDLNGKTVIFKATVKEIYTPIEYNLEYIKSTYGDQYESVEAFEAELKKVYAAQQLLSYFLENTIVLGYPKAEKRLIANQLKDMELDFATQYGIEFDTYLKTYLGFESREAYICYTMKSEMAYYAYAQQQGIVPTSADIANARASLIAYYQEEYLSSSSSITDAQALELATSFVDQQLTESDIYQEAIYALVGDHLETQFVMKEIAATYTSVTKGGSLFDAKAE